MRRRLTPTRSLPSQVQAFFLINTISPLGIVPPAFASQQDLNPRESIPDPHLGQILRRATITRLHVVQTVDRGPSKTVSALEKAAATQEGRQSFVHQGRAHDQKGTSYIGRIYLGGRPIRFGRARPLAKSACLASEKLPYDVATLASFVSCARARLIVSSYNSSICLLQPRRPLTTLSAQLR